MLFIRIALMAIVSYIATNTILANASYTTPIMYCFVAASCTILASYLFAPTELFSANIFPLFAWSLITAFVAHAIFILHTGLPLMGWRYNLLTAGVFIISFLLVCLHKACDSYVENRHITFCIVLTVVILFSSAPMWLGPIAYIHGQNEKLINTIINISPLSYLSVMADYDYLRSPWFYQNTPYGGLRFAYLTPALSTAYYLLCSGLAVIACRRQKSLLQYKNTTSFLARLSSMQH